MRRNALWMLACINALLLLLLCPEAQAQALPGMIGFKAFQIRFSNQTVGYFVVIDDTAVPPTGYSAGYEYWTWTSGTPWRGAFKLVPIQSVPAYASYTWTAFPHSDFDLSTTTPFPSVSPSGNDGFWEVSVEDGGTWTRQAFLWLVDGAPDVTHWYGVDLADVGIGDGTLQIRFESVEAPESGTLDVYLLDEN